MIKNRLKINPTHLSSKKGVFKKVKTKFSKSSNLVTLYNKTNEQEYKESNNIKKTPKIQKEIKVEQSNKSLKLNKGKKFIKMQMFHYYNYLLKTISRGLNFKCTEKCYEKKFLKVYRFLCQLFDITTYMKLQTEFRILKGFLSPDEKAKLENEHKINVNSQAFNKHVNLI